MTREETREDRLQAFIDASHNREVVWGESDCCSWPVAWARAESGKRIVLPKYESRDEAHRLIREAGGLLNVAAPILDGFCRTEFPELGDIGVIRLSDRDVGVIFCKSGIAAWRAETGMSFLRPAKILAAWSV